LKSDAKAVSKLMGKFLKLCGNRIQVGYPFSPVLGFSHWKAKIDWLYVLGRCRKMHPQGLGS
jgi:hypothetical protein